MCVKPGRTDDSVCVVCVPCYVLVTVTVIVPDEAAFGCDSSEFSFRSAVSDSFWPASTVVTSSTELEVCSRSSGSDDDVIGSRDLSSSAAGLLCDGSLSSESVSVSLFCAVSTSFSSSSGFFFSTTEHAATADL